jgi:formate-dependent nitrite reductase cytochrome c552 subunit
VRSPLLNINRACQGCHRIDETKIRARVDAIQTRNHDLLQRGGTAITALIDRIVAAKQAGASGASLQAARELQRKAQWRLDFIAAENSKGSMRHKRRQGCWRRRSTTHARVNWRRRRLRLGDSAGDSRGLM